MLFRDIGFIGTGLWAGEPTQNDYFGEGFGIRAQVKDPYHGNLGAGGALRIAGMELSPEEYPRALAAIDIGFRDPFRGTSRRRYFPPDLKVSDAETEASRNALADAGIRAADIDAVLVQSFLPDELQPKNAAKIAYNLGITRAPAWELDSLCNSSFTHFNVGASLILSGFARHVLCVQSVAYSRVADPGASSRVQEGDMASAFVLGPSPGTTAACSWRTDGRLHGAIKLQWAPESGAGERKYWERSQEGLRIRFDAALQAQVMGEIAHNARVVCAEALDKAEMRREDVDVCLHHQPMNWYGAFLADVLGLADNVVFDTFEEYANINAAGTPASLHHARLAGRVRPGSNVLMFGPAAGYTFAAMAIRWGNR